MDSVALDIAGIDPAFKAHASRGIGRYVGKLREYLLSHQPADFEVREFSSFATLTQGTVASLIDAMPFGRTTLRQQILGPFAFGRLGSRLLHFPAHIDAPAWCRCPYVVTVLDLIPLLFEDLYKADRPSWRFTLARKLECAAIRHAAMVLCISRNTARDVERILGVPPERIVVTPLGVDASFFEETPAGDVRARLGLPQGRPLVVYLGGIDQRKNMAALIEVFARMRASMPEVSPALVIAGRVAEDLQYPALCARIADAAVQGDVFFTGYVGDTDLRALFADTAAFFFPSLYEGFGLPPLEAMASGVPVVSSNRSCMPEVLGDGGVLVDPDDHAGAAAALGRILGDREFASALSAKGRAQARRFGWDRCGEATIEAYRRALRSL